MVAWPDPSPPPVCDPSAPELTEEFPWAQALRAKDMNEMFPVTDAEAPPTANPRGFANLLWKQLDHLGCVTNPQTALLLLPASPFDSDSRFHTLHLG